MLTVRFLEREEGRKGPGWSNRALDIALDSTAAGAYFAAAKTAS
jgi:hypothetical protein